MVREALGLVAYELDDYDTALRELRTHRRITGSNDNLALILDCERGRKNPAKALELFEEIDRSTLSDEEWVECVIVAAGAHTDAGNMQGARDLIEAQGFTGHKPAAIVRLLSAYSDLLRMTGEREVADKYEELARRTARSNAVVFGDEEIDPNEGIEIFTVEEEPEEEEVAELAQAEDEPANEQGADAAIVRAESTQAETTGAEPASAETEAVVEAKQSDSEPSSPTPEQADSQAGPEVASPSTSFAQEVEDEVDEILREAGLTED
ncbi:hypothetical protein NQ038_06405 [Brevibacterium sp. 50QC2O2]|uniref:hypothetical protein n=1 Tax=Brevibacterium TaxID=1696 RepID=UPI00211CBC8A|nr:MULTISPECIES: hypothetical protein [unclassified Brevibacterium]MCQ9384244.1 hypothetical protein [Brevibacterium sp. 68QC2CO]MCQ9388277.1 hypothetical protein [Brevibacterium sp. 50QC2O2]